MQNQPSQSTCEVALATPSRRWHPCRVSVQTSRLQPPSAKRRSGAHPAVRELLARKEGVQQTVGGRSGAPAAPKGWQEGVGGILSTLITKSLHLSEAQIYNNFSRWLPRPPASWYVTEGIVAGPKHVRQDATGSRGAHQTRTACCSATIPLPLGLLSYTAAVILFRERMLQKNDPLRIWLHVPKTSQGPPALQAGWLLWTIQSSSRAGCTELFPPNSSRPRRTSRPKAPKPMHAAHCGGVSGRVPKASPPNWTISAYTRCQMPESSQGLILHRAGARPKKLHPQ